MDQTHRAKSPGHRGEPLFDLPHPMLRGTNTRFSNLIRLKIRCFAESKIAMCLVRHHGAKGSNKNNRLHSTKVQGSGLSAIGAMEATYTVVLLHIITAQIMYKHSYQVRKRINRTSSKS